MISRRILSFSCIGSNNALAIRKKLIAGTQIVFLYVNKLVYKLIWWKIASPTKNTTFVSSSLGKGRFPVAAIIADIFFGFRIINSTLIHRRPRIAQ